MKKKLKNLGKRYLQNGTILDTEHIKYAKKQRGITLISLIVTIIVLLILAGVSLNLVAGSDGILGKASKAVEETKLTSAVEHVQIIVAELQMEYYTSLNLSTSFEDYLTNLNGTGEYVTSDGAIVQFQKGENVIEIKYKKDEKSEVIDMEMSIGGAIEIVGVGGEIVDKLVPTITKLASTTNSITYRITDNRKIVAVAFLEEAGEPTNWETVNQGDYERTVNNLTWGKTYYIWAKDATNEPVCLEVEVAGVGELTYNPPVFDDSGIATIEITSSVDFLKYSTDGGNTWLACPKSLKIPSGTDVQFKQTDGYNEITGYETLSVRDSAEIVYYANNGTSTQIKTVTTYRNAVVDVVEDEPIARQYYDFLGWSEDASSLTEEYNKANSSKNTITVNAKKVELYAVWEPNDQKKHSENPQWHIPTGFEPLTENQNVSEGYVITDGTNEFVWIPVASPEDYQKKLGTNNLSVSELGGNLETSESLMNDVSQAVKGDELGVNSILGKTVTNSKEAQYPEADLVNRVGGFWVGRYEAGIASEEHGEITDTTRWNNAEIIVQAGAEPTRQIYQTQALNLANNWYKYGNRENRKKLDETTVAFQSGLITGTQWDAMCDFIGWEVCDTDCKNWGNYANTLGAVYTGFHSNNQKNDWMKEKDVVKKADFTNRWVFPTGEFVHDGKTVQTTVQKNIYDLAGNVWEFTTEIPRYDPNGISDRRVLRGAGADCDSSFYEVTIRQGYCSAITHASYDVGFRLVLYVQ